ncbi:MAG: AgmX/PglI C-terminal domain-containing protein [Myxococcales bacterium]|nr:AgmX/PglI C-terminal domain-containing protein [Myxococcales bacterium]
MTPAPWSLRRALSASLLLLHACSAGADLSTEQLSAVVEAQQPGLQRCYQDALDDHPLKEVVEMSALIRIAPNGAVESVSLDGKGLLPGLEACVEKTITGWKFPTAGRPTDTSLPLVFRPETQSEGS